MTVRGRELRPDLDEKALVHELCDLAAAWESLGVLNLSQARAVRGLRIPHLRRLIDVLERELEDELDANRSGSTSRRA